MKKPNFFFKGKWKQGPGGRLWLPSLQWSQLFSPCSQCGLPASRAPFDLELEEPHTHFHKKVLEKKESSIFPLPATSVWKQWINEPWFLSKLDPDTCLRNSDDYVQPEWQITSYDFSFCKIECLPVYISTLVVEAIINGPYPFSLLRREFSMIHERVFWWCPEGVPNTHATCLASLHYPGRL